MGFAANRGHLLPALEACPQTAGAVLPKREREPEVHRNRSLPHCPCNDLTAERVQRPGSLFSRGGELRDAISTPELLGDQAEAGTYFEIQPSISFFADLSCSPSSSAGFPGNTSLINPFHWGPWFRVCFWEDQSRPLVLHTRKWRYMKVESQHKLPRLGCGKAGTQAWKGAGGGALMRGRGGLGGAGKGL